MILNVVFEIREQSLFVVAAVYDRRISACHFVPAQYSAATNGGKTLVAGASHAKELRAIL